MWLTRTVSHIYHISPCSLGGHQVQLYLLTTSTYVNSGTNLLSSGVCDIQLHISKTKLVVNISAKLLLDKILLNQLIPRVILLSLTQKIAHLGLSIRSSLARLEFPQRLVPRERRQKNRPIMMAFWIWQLLNFQVKVESGKAHYGNHKYLQRKEPFWIDEFRCWLLV